MIVLDTNVVAEFFKVTPDVKALHWFSTFDGARLYITTVTESELRYGALVLPVGKRRNDLLRVIDQTVEDDFNSRNLPFDSAAAKACAEISARRRASGKPISMADCQIAAIAKVYGALLATRNTSDFEDCGIELIDPWKAEF